LRELRAEKGVAVPKSRTFFRYSPVDAIPAVSVVGIVALIFATCVYFHQMPGWVMALAFCAVSLSYVWNLQCLSHNFVHNPFFTWNWLNRAFSVLETIAIGIPQVFYHHYHLNHHAGDNDKKGPDGTTRDWSSIYRHSPNDEPEGFFRYVILGYFRVEMGPLLRTVWRHGWDEILQAAVECVVYAIFWVGLAWYDWRYFVFFYLPSYYLGWVMSYAEGYFEHFGAQPGNPYANSVSSYNRLYNFLWFNNGYHQEHHWDPKRHWTKVRLLHEEIKGELASNSTRTLQRPHFLAFLEDYWWNRPAGTEGSREERRAA
jgi:fatty acid desaturase